jgi:outer membrane lipoprotein LolB
MGPLGSNGLKLSGQPGRVTLVMSDGKSYTASNPEELLARRWGFHLPVSNLRYWIRGLPVPDLPSNTQFDTSNRLVNLAQDGWQVQFLSYMSGRNTELPEKLVITSREMKVKIIVYQWN